MNCTETAVQKAIDYVLDKIGLKSTDISTIGPKQDTDSINLPSSMKIPLPALKTLATIDDTGTRPPNTRGGQPFDNDGRGGAQVLPLVDAHGNAITYRRWNVNPSPAGKSDQERIVTGSDGSAYYTNNHYHTFEQMRPGKP
jgi:guanyl-specific ribonuclease Sa